MKSHWIVGIGMGAILGYTVYKRTSKTKRRAKENEYLKSCNNEISKFGTKFEGLYEATFQILNASNTDEEAKTLMFSWEARLEDDIHLLHLYEQWEKIFLNQCINNRINQFNEWLNFLESIGVTRVEEKGGLSNKDSIHKYEIISESNDLELNQKIIVIRPYWKIDEVILEKGVCELLD